MYYYIYKDNDDNIVGYKQSNDILLPPAIQVTEEEFKQLGFYSEPQPQLQQDDETSMWDEIADAIKEGVDAI